MLVERMIGGKILRKDKLTWICKVQKWALNRPGDRTKHFQQDFIYLTLKTVWL